ncbi:MAG: hypothetical protein GX827_00745 [Clostridiales bacterium]|nr:hypothetical protein [Clostridiales bacterium]
MAFIHDRKLEKTGYQESSPYSGRIDLGCDFVMVYGIDNDMPERVKEYKKQGYVVHLMTGIAWGHYQDYLFGRWDGRSHLDEGQVQRDGSVISHGKDVPYMVPTVSFTDYLTEKLKSAVDAGVEAIHVEEPEFWDRAGYSEAFKREYLLYYREPWQPPHESADAAYRCAQLKSFLYCRAISRVSQSLKEYSLTKHGKVLRFYVPTHSLINYTTWRIVSPEGSLTDVPSVDGYIAQIWTGTSRTPNVYKGVLKERTFETAYLEYGVMQELVRGTSRRMWFLHDPIEDNPRFDWDDYRFNYLSTVTASLLHPSINDYEITPWPRRVYNGKYPSGSPDAKPIPEDYASQLNSLIQTLGDMPVNEESENKSRKRKTIRRPKVGVLISDSAMWQRTYTDDMKAADEKITDKEENVTTAFRLSDAFPDFYGLAMPLIKRGIEVRPVVAENIRRYVGYLDDYDIIVASYEFIKPSFPDINASLDTWVKEGGIVIYAGDGSDPFNSIRGWWNEGEKKYNNPAEHLFETLGVNRRHASAQKNTVDCGKGRFGYLKALPAAICIDEDLLDKYISLFTKAAILGGYDVSPKNHLMTVRGKYIAAACLDEAESHEPLVLKGLFADMYTPSTEIITEKILNPGEMTLLCDLGKLDEIAEGVSVVGTSARILSIDKTEKHISLKVRAAEGIRAYIRLKLNGRIKSSDLSYISEDIGGTVLFELQGSAMPVDINFELE